MSEQSDTSEASESPEDIKRRHERLKKAAFVILGGTLIVIGSIFIQLGKWGPKALARGRKYLAKARESTERNQ